MVEIILPFMISLTLGQAEFLLQDEGLGIRLQPSYHRPMQERTMEGSHDVEG